MKTLLTLIIALGLSASAFARIGETEAQLSKRYGKPLGSAPASGFVGRVYRYRGFEVVVFFDKGVSCVEEYHKHPLGPLLNADIAALLNANSGGGKWQRVPDSSVDRLVLIIFRGAGKRVAMHDTVRNSLLVTYEDFVARMSGRHEQLLKGF